MGSILDQVEGKAQVAALAVRCPVCAQANTAAATCRHVRWTFDRGGPLQFAKHALSVSPVTFARGNNVSDIPAAWWDANGDWLMEQLAMRFDACEGFVFGELGDIDLLAKDVWSRFQPEAPRAGMTRT